MSKNKNPLKDLDFFLKQQAASFVNPTQLSEKVQSEGPTKPTTSASSTTPEELIEQLETLARFDKNALYDLIIKVAEKQNEADSTMLINTALYLKSGDNWKEVVREYWKNR